MALVIHILINQPQQNARKQKLLEELTRDFRINDRTTSMILFECLRVLEKEHPQLNFFKLLDRHTMDKISRRRNFVNLPGIDEIFRRLEQKARYAPRDQPFQFVIANRPYALRLRRHFVYDLRTR